MRINFFPQSRWGELRNLRKDVSRLHTANLQLSTNILALMEETQGYSSNLYETYEKAVAALDEKYRGAAKWGCSQTGNIIDLRAFCIMAEGIKVSEKKEGEATKEIEFAKNFLSFNDLDKEIAQEYAKEAELDGKILVSLAWDIKSQNVTARFVSWTSKKYTIEADPLDYTWYVKAKWTETDKPVELLEPVFVYKKFGGRLNQPNQAMSKTMKMLTKIEDLDKAQRDWRLINYLFAGPILHAECATAQAVDKAQENLDNINMKIGKGIAHLGTLGYLQPSMEGAEMLEKEIVMLIKTVSAGTGVPVHYLGYPDLLSNRATAENLMDLIVGMTSKERITWEAAFEEMVDKAIVIWNEKTGSAQKSSRLQTGQLDFDIPIITQATWDRIEKVFIPMKIAGSIDDKTLLSQVPGINPQAILEALEEDKNVELKPPKKTIPLTNPFAEDENKDEEDIP